MNGDIGLTGDRYLCGQAHADVFAVTCWASGSSVNLADGRKIRCEHVGMTAALIAAQRWLATGPDARVRIERVAK